jgi:hypothetical protein
MMLSHRPKDTHEVVSLAIVYYGSPGASEMGAFR